MNKARRNAIFVLLTGVALLAEAQGPPGLVATIDRMTAAGKNQREIADYTFQAAGCKGCHVASADGKVGFTLRGEQAGQGFEGCLRLLASMNFVAQIPEKQRSAEQQARATQFEQFGCTFCHQITPGRTGFTAVGKKLSYMHLSCVQAEKQSGRTAATVGKTKADVSDCCKK